MVVGYLRVSTEKQIIQNQKTEIENFAQSNGLIIDRWFSEVYSGNKSLENRQLLEALEMVNKGDVLIISEVSRLSRRMYDIIAIFSDCIKKDVRLYCVKEGYVIGDDLNSKIMGFAFSLAAEIERNLISMRTKEALANRKARGMILGRPKGSGKKLKLLQDNTDLIMQMIENKESLQSIANKYKVSRTTLYSFLKK